MLYGLEDVVHCRGGYNKLVEKLGGRKIHPTPLVLYPKIFFCLPSHNFDSRTYNLRFGVEWPSSTICVSCAPSSHHTNILQLSYPIVEARQSCTFLNMSHHWVAHPPGDRLELTLFFSLQRLAKWFTTLSPKEKAKIIKDVSQLVLSRRTRMCNFLEYKGTRDVAHIFSPYPH